MECTYINECFRAWQAGWGRVAVATGHATQEASTTRRNPQRECTTTRPLIWEPASRCWCSFCCQLSAPQGLQQGVWGSWESSQEYRFPTPGSVHVLAPRSRRRTVAVAVAQRYLPSPLAPPHRLMGRDTIHTHIYLNYVRVSEVAPSSIDEILRLRVFYFRYQTSTDNSDLLLFGYGSHKCMWVGSADEYSRLIPPIVSIIECRLVNTI